MAELDRMLRKQEELVDRVAKAFVNYKKSSKSRITAAYIETRLEALEKSSKAFFEGHHNLVANIDKSKRDEIEYFSKDQYSEFEETYTDFKTKLKEDLQTFKPRSSSCESTSTPTATAGCEGCSEVKLPQIHLPKFNGGYEQWQAFYDLFVSLIHNNKKLSAVQKLHYLKSCLSGEAEGLLKNLATTESNYSEAWKVLTGRYSNKRYNCNEIMKRLFTQKSITSESANAIKQLVDTTSSCLKSLENINISTSSWDAIINYLILSKVDVETRKMWELEVNRMESENSVEHLPTWLQLKKFLETRFRTLEMLEPSHSNATKSTAKPANSTNSTKQPAKSRAFHSTVNEEKKSSYTCAMCSGQHPIYQCKEFETQTPEKRSEFIQTKGLCFNCLSTSHAVKNCHNSTSCRRCGKRHHTLLHFERANVESPTTTEKTEQPSSTSQSETRVVAHFTKESHQSRVLLATAMIRVKSSNGHSQIVRALIDQGSEASFINEATAQSLLLKGTTVNGVVSGVGDGQTRTKHRVSFNIESLQNPNFSIPVNAFVLKRLTSFLPARDTSIPNWPEIENLPLADPQYGTPGKIEMILGVEVHGEILLQGLLRHASGPVAQNTQLGWILSGRVGADSTPDQRIVSMHIQMKEEQLLKQFWEIEREPDSIGKRMTKEEIRAEEIYEATTLRNSEGRYVVRLPFTSENPECQYGQSREVAMRRFKSLEKRLLRDTKLHEDYKDVIEDYVKQNHMREITEREEIDDPYAVYLPHHAVIREDKETTRVRVVFDASSKGLNNVSLNDNLLVGPKLQQDLRHILMRWRRHEICIVADLRQMYRQVCVNESDADFQRILWRPSPDVPIQHFKLLRLTFGTSCAPYLAVKSLQQLAKDERAEFPVAAQITLTDYYMDDLLTGCETTSQAVEIYNEMNNLMRRGGFELQKWCSNSTQLLNHIQEEKQRSSPSMVFKSSDIKVLGILWSGTNDEFKYNFNLPETENVTKRTVLSEIARLYDPIGWISPVIIVAKIFIQKLWRAKLEWDETLNPQLLQEWRRFKMDLVNVKDLSIPRWLQTKSNDNVELHAFADASKVAYAAAVYLRSTNRDGKTTVNLITAKTKVAPVEKEISIPRMELCAALLATKLIYEVSQIMDIPKENLYAWSDSTVVLAWIAGEPSRWTTFVSNRISEILTMLDRDQWRHVTTDQNPADCASRGLTLPELTNHDLWWHGPQWLLREEHRDEPKNEFETIEETRAIKVLSTTVNERETEDFIWTRFSDLPKMLRVLSYCKRFSNLKLPKEDRKKVNQTVTIEEKNEILKFCIKETQAKYFQQEIERLRAQKSVPKRSQLHTLCPFLDESGILRVGGRIHKAQVDYNKRHPIILPSKSHLTDLIIRDSHHRTLHGGPQLMLNFLRSKYWICRARELAKKCHRTCVVCLRYSQPIHNQLMGQLPEPRLKPMRPFKISGVDYTGHINIRFSPGRGAKSYKGYICLFVCLSTKAIHLEAVSDLTSQGFIAAFRRFISRRGHCQTLYSDNGTNFIGADKELRDMFNRAVSTLPDEIQHLLANEGTDWKFIPPLAPHFGGLWEAGVRSAKKHLKRVVGDSTLTFEELTTVLTQIEACLNSRPLSYLSDNPDDPVPLTPGHFLVGEPLTTIPDEEIHEESNISNMRRWKFCQKMMNDFWRRWSNEYLVTLSQRYKWTTPKSEPEFDDIVLIKDKSLPPAKWLLGRVIAKHTGQDNLTRVVSIKTKSGICKRPCNKLVFCQEQLSRCLLYILFRVFIFIFIFCVLNLESFRFLFV